MGAVTEHKQLGGAGLGSLFDAAFKQSRNPMAVQDSNRRLIDVNGAYLRFLGCTRQQLIGHPIYEHVVSGPALSQAEFAAAVAQGRYLGVATFRTASGQDIRVQYAGTTEVITGSYRILIVILSTARWGRHLRRTSSPAGRHATLSTREREIVGLVAMGETGPEIAEELHIAHETVRTHVRNAMDKLDARSRAHLVAKALGDGIVLSEMLSTERPRSAVGA